MAVLDKTRLRHRISLTMPYYSLALQAVTRPPVLLAVVVDGAGVCLARWERGARAPRVESVHEIQLLRLLAAAFGLHTASARPLSGGGARQDTQLTRSA